MLHKDLCSPFGLGNRAQVQHRMLIARALVLLLLVAAAALFGWYAVTGDLCYRRLGLLVLKWTVGAGLLFFAVLFVQRIA